MSRNGEYRSGHVPKNVAPIHGSRIHPRGAAAVRGQLAYISSSEKCYKCVIIHNLSKSVNLCIVYVLIMS